MSEKKKDGIIYLKTNNNGDVQLTYEDAVEIVNNKTPFYINGQFIRAKVCNSDSFRICDYCDMDCLCKKPISTICTDLELATDKPIILELMSKQR